MDDILWNIPEQKSGTVTILGGNLHSFAPVAKTAEYFTKMPIKNIRTYLPDSLKSNIPSLPDIFFTKSTTTGSFDKSPELNAAVKDADITLLAGDFSKNSATAVAIADALKNSENPTVWAKDTTDLLATEAQDLLPNGNITLIATLSQLQKLLRAIYYPKMLLLSMPIQPIKEVLHKFTLSYPVTILTFHDGQIIIASNGELHTTPLEKSGYTPLTLWTTDLPAKITALQAWNPNKPYDSTIAALSYKP